jgi:hypothetical protein
MNTKQLMLTVFFMIADEMMLIPKKNRGVYSHRSREGAYKKSGEQNSPF